MEKFYKNKYISEFIENFSHRDHIKLLKYFIIIGIDYVNDFGVFKDKNFFTIIKDISSI